MITKKKLLQTIKDLPENFSIDDIMDKLLLIDKIETGLAQSAKGEGKTTEQAKVKLRKWLK